MVREWLLSSCLQVDSGEVFCPAVRESRLLSLVEGLSPVIRSGQTL